VALRLVSETFLHTTRFKERSLSIGTGCS